MEAQNSESSKTLTTAILPDNNAQLNSSNMDLLDLLLSNNSIHNVECPVVPEDNMLFFNDSLSAELDRNSRIDNFVNPFNPAPMGLSSNDSFYIPANQSSPFSYSSTPTPELTGLINLNVPMEVSSNDLFHGVTNVPAFQSSPFNFMSTPTPDIMGLSSNDTFHSVPNISNNQTAPFCYASTTSPEMAGLINLNVPMEISSNDLFHGVTNVYNNQSPPFSYASAATPEITGLSPNDSFHSVPNIYNSQSPPFSYASAPTPEMAGLINLNVPMELSSNDLFHGVTNVPAFQSSPFNFMSTPTPAMTDALTDLIHADDVCDRPPGLTENKFDSESNFTGDISSFAIPSIASETPTLNHLSIEDVNNEQVIKSSSVDSISSRDEVDLTERNSKQTSNNSTEFVPCKENIANLGEASDNRTYVVATGDTIEGISLRTGISISNLQRINRIYGKHVYVGQVLNLNVPKRPLASGAASASNGPLTDQVSAQSSLDLESHGGPKLLGKTSSIDIIRVNSEKALSSKLDSKTERIADVTKIPKLGSSGNLSSRNEKQRHSGVAGGGPPNGLLSTIGKGLWGVFWGPKSKSMARQSIARQSSASNLTSFYAHDFRERSNSATSSTAVRRRSHSEVSRSHSHSDDDEEGGQLLPRSRSDSPIKVGVPHHRRMKSESSAPVPTVVVTSAAAAVSTTRPRSQTTRRLSFLGRAIEKSESVVKSADESDEAQQLLLDPSMNTSMTVFRDPERTILNDLEWLHAEEDRLSREEPPISPPNMVGSSHILTNSISSQIVQKLPQTLQDDTWMKLYSILDNGTDSTSFFAKIQYHKFSLIIVETTDGDIFGGFADTEWNISQSFYGSGQCFLLRIDNDIVATFPWTRLNDMFMWSNFENVAMGGGGGGFGFVLDNDFTTGSTCTCETFCNPPLIKAPMGTFDIKNLEVWGFSSGMPRNGGNAVSFPKTTVLRESYKRPQR